MTTTAHLHRRSRSLWLLLAIGAILSLLLVLFAHVPLSATQPPGSQQLPWENADGTVNVNALPSTLPFMDCDGTIADTMTDPFEQEWLPTCIDVQTQYNQYENGH